MNHEIRTFGLTFMLTGVVESADDAKRASRAATGVQRVVAVKNRLTWR